MSFWDRLVIVLGMVALSVSLYASRSADSYSANEAHVLLDECQGRYAQAVRQITIYRENGPTLDVSSGFTTANCLWGVTDYWGRFTPDYGGSSWRELIADGGAP